MVTTCQNLNRNWPATGRRHQAFTWIELVVIIAVVAVLLALSWPRRTPENPLTRRLLAQRAECLYNVKQLAAAEFMYSADNRGRFCPSYLDYSSLELKNVWMGALANYHGQTNGIWLCPSTSNAPLASYRGNAETPWTYTDPVSDRVIPGSYAINGHLGLGANYKKMKDSSFKVQNVFHREAAVPKPAQTPAFTDAMYWNCSLEETDAPERNLYEPRGIVTASGIRKILTQIIARHGDFPAAGAPREIETATLPGAINIAFVDGHAENVPLENLWTLYWHKNWNPEKVPSPHPSPQ